MPPLITDLPPEVIESIYLYLERPESFSTALSLQPSTLLTTRWICFQSKVDLRKAQTHPRLFDWSNRTMWKSVSVSILQQLVILGIDLDDKWLDILHCSWRYKKWPVVNYALDSCYVPKTWCEQPSMVHYVVSILPSPPQYNIRDITALTGMGAPSTSTALTPSRPYSRLPQEDVGYFMEKAVRENQHWIAKKILQYENFHAELLYWFMRLAMQNQNFAIVDLLIDHGLDIKGRNFFNTLARFGSPAMMSHYIRKVSRYHDMSLAINSAFITSCGHNRKDMMVCLLQLGADIHYLHDFCLWDSVTKKDIPLTHFLLQHGADVHMCQEQPLRTAVWQGNLEMVKLLVFHGADWECKMEDLIAKATKNKDKEMLLYFDDLIKQELS